LTLPVHLIVLLGYTLLTLILTDPLPSKLTTEVIGGGDAWQHIWNLWWARESLLSGPSNPYFTDLLYYPDGVPLYFHTLVLTAGLLSLPLQMAGLSLITTYNIVLLLTFLLAGYGAFLLCHYLTGHKWGSFVGGCVFAFSPYHFAHLYGHMNLASLQWIPFYVLLLLRAIDEPGREKTTDDRRHVTNGESRQQRGAFRIPRSVLLAAGAGALLALNAYTDWLYAIFLALLTGLILAWKVLVPVERRAFAGRGVGWREGAIRLLAGGVVAFALVSPIFFPTLTEANKGYAQQPPRETLVYSSDFTLAFTPSELHPIWGSRVAEHVSSMGPYSPLKHPSERTVFLGYSVLLLSGYGLWRLRQKQRVRMWAFLAFATWVLSLGPVLQVLGKSTFTAFGIEVPMPYLLLYKLPLFSIMRTPSRLTVLTMLALGVLVAFAFVALMAGRETVEESGRERTWLRVVSQIGLPFLILFEFWAAPFSTVPPGWDVPIYTRVASEPGRFALLELPLRPFGDYMAYQTVHGKPIVGGYLSRQPPYVAVESTPALRYLRDDTAADDPARDSIAGGKGVSALRDMGVKYVIIRWWAFTAEQRSAMQTKLGALLGRPPDISYPEHQVEVWQLYR
jgi:hypothetical protein